MLQQQQYVSEKLRELEAAHRHTSPSFLVDVRPAPRRRGAVGIVARVAGRQVRRLGEALESWGTPQAAAH